MKKKHKMTWLVAGWVACGYLGWSACSGWPLPAAQAQDHTQTLSASVTRLTDWLEGSPQAEQWRVYLDLNAIETLIGRGSRASAAELEQAAQRFSQAHSSLQHPNFRGVRDALAEQARRIRAAEEQYPESVYSAENLAGWSQAFAAAAKELQPMTGQQLNAKRLRTLAEVLALRKYIDERGPNFQDYASPPPVLAALRNVGSTEQAPLTPAEQLQQLDLTIRWLEVAVTLPWESSAAPDAAPAAGANAASNPTGGPATGRISDEAGVGNATVQRIGDTLDDTLSPVEPVRGAAVRQVAWQDVPADPSLNDLLNGLRTQQTWLQDQARRDPNPYAALANWLLLDYVNALNLGRRENMPQLLARQVDNLIAGLEHFHAGGDRNKQLEVARIIGLLENVDQAVALTTAFKRTFWRQNALVYVGESLVNQLASRPVQQTQPVYEVILDNEVFGTATTQGQVTIDFVPNPSQAHISLQMTGRVASDNYTPAGPITAYTGSQADVEARRSIYLNVGGWYQRAPYGAANLQSHFKGTSCGRLIDRLAEAQFQNQQPAAEAIGARRAENRLVQQFERETSTALQQGRRDMQQRRQEIGWLRDNRPTAYLLTDENFLQVYGKKYNGTQTLALNAPPAIDTPSQLAVQLHDSFITNTLEAALAGRVITHEDVARIEDEIKREIEANGGQVPATAPVQREAFELTLANARPVELRFEEQMIQVVINIRNFKAQGQSINDAQVLVRMKLLVDPANPNQLRLRQLGDVRASLLDPNKIDLNTATVLDLIENTLNRELQRQRESETGQPGLALPLSLLDPQWVAELGDPQVSRLLASARLVALSFEQGWATVAWRTSGAATPATDLPAIVDAETFERLSQQASASEQEAR